jgi:uncharacterized protein YndB with AHSA1/START domain
MKNLKKTIHIKVPREEVFNALVNPLTIELWSGFKAEMQPVVGSEFTLFEGDISGVIKSLDPPNAVEQVWNFGDQEEESLVRYELFEESGKTRLELSHTNIPDEAYENIETGWKEYFLGAMKNYLES